jgi:hypothetical protein
MKGPNLLPAAAFLVAFAIWGVGTFVTHSKSLAWTGALVGCVGVSGAMVLRGYLLERRDRRDRRK